MNDFLQSLRNGQAEKARTPKTRKNFDNSYYSNTSRFNSYGGSGYPSNNRSPQMKRPMPPGVPQAPGNQVAEDPNTVLLADILDNLGTQVDILIKNQEYMITIQERTADLLQRQADAIEIIMDRLNLSQEQEMDIAPTFEHHYVSSQAPDEDEVDGTVEDLLRAEMAEEERRKASPQPQQTDQGNNIVKKRRKIVAPPAAPAPTQAESSGGAAELMPREEIMDIINTMREQGATYDQVAKHLIDLGQPTFSGRGEWHAQTIHRLCSNK
ncbi:hypothetical protein [uncultured Desulfobacter sp.]|uniref:hypothetical protein n=1 Tax=uncultured Desulfobacter sp. TaxID=240139 RepID=UPI0029F4DA7D|nr:hypothetical protein [uncultured Desulfobacter sp.]